MIVNGIVNASPAEAAGLTAGDIVLRFDGTEIEAEKDEDLGRFQRLVAATPVGKQVRVEVLRGGEHEVLSIMLAAQPKVVPDEEESDVGFTVQEVTARLERIHRLESRTGVLVSFVERGSEAAEAGLAVGDLVEKVDESVILDIEAFRSAQDSLAPERPFLIQVRRGENTRFILIVPRSPGKQVDSGIRSEKTGG